MLSVITNNIDGFYHKIFLLLCLGASLSICTSCTRPPDITITRPGNGVQVFGIVRCTAEVTGTSSYTIKFYCDAINDSQLIAIVTSPVDSLYTAAWYTPDVMNGTHTLYAVAFDEKGTTAQASVNVTVDNGTRAGAIPADVLKMTPENDPHPPFLNPDLPYLKDLWEDPVPLEGPINTAGAEDSPFITPDSSTFFFWFNGDERKSVYEQLEDPMTGIYWSKKVNGTWTEPDKVFLDYYDEISLDGAPTVRGDTLWFASARAGNYRDLDMWTAKLENGRWTDWTNAGELLNKEYEIGELHVSADGTEIYFDSSRAGGKGNKDIWITKNVGGQWQAPENIEAVNTEITDGWPFVSDDGTELWFTRSGAGAPEIYRSIHVNGYWQTPELILTSFAGEPTLDRDGTIYFVHHRWDELQNRVSEADIYVCYRKK